MPFRGSSDGRHSLTRLGGSVVENSLSRNVEPMNMVFTACDVAAINCPLDLEPTYKWSSLIDVGYGRAGGARERSGVFKWLASAKTKISTLVYFWQQEQMGPETTS